MRLIHVNRTVLYRKFYCRYFLDPRRFKFDPSQIESVDQMLLGAKIAQTSLSPVAEESMDGAEQPSTFCEHADKTLERYMTYYMTFRFLTLHRNLI